MEIDYRGKNVIAPVYINAGQGQPHEPFLCGTNILFSLSLLSVDAGVTARTEDYRPVRAQHEVPKPVKLLRVENIPGWSGAVLRVSVGNCPHTGSMHYIPSDRSSVTTEEAVIDVCEGQVLISVLNYSQEPVKIDQMSELGSVVNLVEEEGSLFTNERIYDPAGRSCVVTACSGKEEKNVPYRRGAERERSHPDWRWC